MQLPLELWLEVLRQVENLKFKNPHDRLVVHQNFRLVCKAFRGLADGFVFKKVFVTNTQRSVSDLDELTLKFGHLIRELTICINPHEMISQQECDDYIARSRPHWGKKPRYDYHAYCEAYSQQVGAPVSIEQLQQILGTSLARAPRVEKIALSGLYTCWFRNGDNPDPRRLMRRHLSTCRQREVCNILDLAHESHNRTQYLRSKQEDRSNLANNLLICLCSVASANNITLTEMTMDGADGLESWLSLGILEIENTAFHNISRVMKHLRVLDTSMEERDPESLRHKLMGLSRRNTITALHYATNLRRFNLAFMSECASDTFDLVFRGWRLPKLQVLSLSGAIETYYQQLTDLLKNTKSLHDLSLIGVWLLDGTWEHVLEFIKDETFIKKVVLGDISSDHSTYDVPLQRSNDRLVGNYLHRQGKNPLSRFGVQWHECLIELKRHHYDHQAPY